MSVEQHIPATAADTWLNSLERAVEICRDQVTFARAMNIGSIAVPVDSLERILNATSTSQPKESEG